jgi:hypothetical protein
MKMSRPIYVIGKQETVVAGTALMRIVISDEHTRLMQGFITSDFNIVNIFLFFLPFTRFFLQAVGILLNECRKFWGKQRLL